MAPAFFNCFCIRNEEVTVLPDTPTDCFVSAHGTWRMPAVFYITRDTAHYIHNTTLDVPA